MPADPAYKPGQFIHYNIKKFTPCGDIGGVVMFREDCTGFLFPDTD